MNYINGFYLEKQLFLNIYYQEHINIFGYWVHCLLLLPWNLSFHSPLQKEKRDSVISLATWLLFSLPARNFFLKNHMTELTLSPTNFTVPGVSPLKISSQCYVEKVRNGRDWCDLSDMIKLQYSNVLVFQILNLGLPKWL